ncbi:hypothetical protein [Halorubrum tebenquichense]|uniref:Uncharacterized protein n=1 Tax=Halorubrum tebenquichense DSM 14210 TaxID=1227485 RepID=M0DWK2_9EURY|nr:hypothetical protein [Halorubrum tebenquichense]ELZ39915.1 hypothetical protein C472_02714 [Halorubrum tebenquichense DSM 14210]
MDWVTALPAALFALAWLSVPYYALREDWSAVRTAGMAVFLAAATAGTYLDEFLAPGSPLLPWIEPVAAAVMVGAIYVAFVREPSGQNESDDTR